MPDQIRIGVLGCADIAVRRMMPAFAAAPDVELAAVASRDAASAARAAAGYGADAVHGYTALLDRDDIDAVYVPVPAALHETWIGRALDHGKHVLAEKPLTTSASTTGGLLRRADELGLVLMENMMFVHHPRHELAGSLAASGAIGALRSLTATFTVPRLPAHDIRHVGELGGGALLDIGVYPIRAALHLLGGPLEVIGAVLESGHAEVEHSGAALLRGPGGVSVQIGFGMDHAYRSEYELCGSEGRIHVDRAFTPPADLPPVVRLTRYGRVEDIVLDPCDQVAATVAAFAAAVRKGRHRDDECIEQAHVLDEVRRAACTKSE